DVWLAVAREGTAHAAVDWRRPSAILIGGEAHGAGEEAGRLATGRVTIPMRDSTESLNAALAAAVLLFEAARQREERRPHSGLDLQGNLAGIAAVEDDAAAAFRASALKIIELVVELVAVGIHDQPGERSIPLQLHEVVLRGKNRR